MKLQIINQLAGTDLEQPILTPVTEADLPKSFDDLRAALFPDTPNFDRQQASLVIEYASAPELSPADRTTVIGTLTALQEILKAEVVRLLSEAGATKIPELQLEEYQAIYNGETNLQDLIASWNVTQDPESEATTEQSTEAAPAAEEPAEAVTAEHEPSDFAPAPLPTQQLPLYSAKEIFTLLAEHTAKQDQADQQIAQGIQQTLEGTQRIAAAVQVKSQANSALLQGVLRSLTPMIATELPATVTEEPGEAQQQPETAGEEVIA